MKSEIIAECGAVHRSYAEASDRMHGAIHAGADTVKFQLFVPDEPLFCPMPGDDKRWDRWGDSMLPEDDWANLKRIAENHGRGFLVSVFQPGGLAMAKRLGCKRIKVASRAAMPFPYRDWGGEFIVSDGFDEFYNPDPAVLARIRFMQCVPDYPPPLAEAKWHGDPAIGLSDHSGTPWVAIDALARGCKMIEVHVDGMPGSIAFEQLKLITEARDAFAAMSPS